MAGMLEIDALSIILEKNQGIRFASCNHHALFVNQMIKARRSFFFSCAVGSFHDLTVDPDLTL